MLAQRSASPPASPRWCRGAGGFAPWLLALATVAAPPAAAQVEDERNEWRSYSSVDGLRESWIEDVTEGHSGRLLITHGSVDAMAVYDGYAFQRHPSPGPNLTVREAPDGVLWALVRQPSGDFTGLQFMGPAGWTRVTARGIDVPIALARLFVPWAPGRVVLLSSAGLLEYRQATSAVAPLDVPAGLGSLRTLAPRRAGGIWIGGAGGLAWAEAGEEARAPVWRVIPLPATRRTDVVRDVRDCGAAGLFVTVEQDNGRRAVLAHREGGWTLVVGNAPAGEVLAAWASQGEIWVLGGNWRSFTLERVGADGRRRRVRRAGALSGYFLSALVDRSGALWIATSQGLAMHRQLAWRSQFQPAPTVGFGTLFETRSGDLLSLSESGITMRRASGWSTTPLPEGVQATDFTDGVAELADGRIVFNAPQPRARLLAFDPASGTFQRFEVPGAERATLLATTGGRLWVHARRGSERWIAAIDGDRVERIASGGSHWGAQPPRGLLVASNGDVFVLPDGVGVGHARPGGRYEVLDARRGFPGAGPFCGLEIGPDRYWFGDRDGILELAGGRWRQVRGGLQTVRALLRARDGTIWATSGTGVHAYRNGSWVSMAEAEGIPDGGATDVLEDRSGAIWVSTPSGLRRFDRTVDDDPPQTLLDPAINPRETPPSGSVRLTFAGKDRWDQTPVDRLLFSWRLDGGAWTPFTPEPGAVLEGLAAGEHTIEARAMDRNWNVDARPPRLPLRVLLPWYREIGFVAVLAAAALVLVALVGVILSRHRRLGRLVAERTAELAESNAQLRRELADRLRMEAERTRLEQELHQAQRLEAIGRLAGGIAHDFNNLLTVIASYADLIAQDLREGDPSRAAVDEITRAADRAAELTRQLLAFGRHQLRHPEVLDLNAVVRDLERMLRRLITEDVRLEVRCGALTRRVRADRSQLEQVIVNLAINARDAMPSGGVLTIETSEREADEEFLHAHPETPAGPSLVLTVRDTGTGMDAETLSRAFEPFFTTKSRGKGTGLGLASAYGTVKQAGGHVWIESQPGRGTAVTIALPATSEPLPAQATAAVAPAGGSERILIVEDDEAVRALAATVLRQHGYAVTEAAHAEAAEALLSGADAAFDLLLSDVVMPGLSGPQLVERIRPRLPALRVLLMSGYADEAILRHTRFDREGPFIQKPFTAQSLAAKVRETLDRPA